MNRSLPSWFDDIDFIKPPPGPSLASLGAADPEPVDPPAWTVFFPEVEVLRMVWIRGAWTLRCVLCSRDLRGRRPRKKEQVRDAWVGHLETKRHVTKTLWIEANFLGLRTDVRLARSIAIAVERGFG